MKNHAPNFMNILSLILMAIKNDIEYFIEEKKTHSTLTKDL